MTIPDWRPGPEHRVLVCGGRDYQDRDGLFAVLDELNPKPTHIIAGGAPGADTFAMQWAVNRSVACTVFAAEWSTYGKSAGPRRNQRMLDEGRPHLVVAFPRAGGSFIGPGTASMIAKARAAGVPVFSPHPLPAPPKD